MRLIALAIALAAHASGAPGQAVYKYSDPSGRVVYTDDPAAGNGTAKRLQIPPRPEGRPAAGLSEGEKKLLDAANRHAAELDRAAADIVSAHDALRAAEARRAEGVEPLEGERQGRRYRPEYWARQQALAREVDAARARLDDALARRNALR